MNELCLIESYVVNNVAMDILFDGKFRVTRTQLGEALEYSDPRVAITKIHAKHKGRLDSLSTSTRLVTVDGKEREAVLYTLRGALEICRWSRQPKADLVMDSLYDIFETVAEKGYYSTMTDEQLYELLGKRLSGHQEVVLREYKRTNPSSIKSVVPLAIMEERVVVEKVDTPVYPAI